MDNRFYFSEINGEFVTFKEQECIHISRVMRKQVGDNIVGFNGDGLDYNLQISNITKSTVTAKILSKSKNRAMDEINITVYLAMLKNDALADAIDILAELNVRQVKLFKADFSVANVDEKKLNKLTLNSIVASKQCERADVMQISIISKKAMEEEIKKTKNCFFAYENSNEKIASFNGDFSVIIGPEGGFSNTEAETYSKLATPISLGKTILRAPVACATAVSSLKAVNNAR